MMTKTMAKVDINIISRNLNVLISPVADVALRRPSRSMELKRRQATSIVLLGVIGAEFGQDVGDNKRKSETELRKKTTVEGFGLGPNQNLARLTST